MSEGSPVEEFGPYFVYEKLGVGGIAHVHRAVAAKDERPVALERMLSHIAGSDADLFAVDVIAHELLTNQPLFCGRDDIDTLTRVRDMHIDPPSPPSYKTPPGAATSWPWYWSSSQQPSRRSPFISCCRS